jgi:PKD repeat protein
MASFYVDIGVDNGAGAMDGSDTSNYMGWNQFISDVSFSASGSIYLFRGTRDYSSHEVWMCNANKIFDAWDINLYGPWRLATQRFNHANYGNLTTKNGVVKFTSAVQLIFNMEDMYVDLTSAGYYNSSDATVTIERTTFYRSSPCFTWSFGSSSSVNSSLIAFTPGIYSCTFPDSTPPNSTFSNGVLTSDIFSHVFTGYWTITDSIEEAVLEKTAPDPMTELDLTNFNLLNGYGVGSPGSWSLPTIEVDFTSDYTVGVTPFLVNFTSTVTGLTNVSYLWDFGDGNTSTDANPYHTYTSVGSYTVRVTVTDIDTYATAYEEKSGYITTCSMSASISPTSGRAPLLVTFTDLSTIALPYTITERTWTFGDGDTETTANASIQHQYTTVGSFSVRLRIKVE